MFRSIDNGDQQIYHNKMNRRDIDTDTGGDRDRVHKLLQELVFGRMNFAMHKTDLYSFVLGTQNQQMINILTFHFGLRTLQLTRLNPMKLYAIGLLNSPNQIFNLVEMLCEKDLWNRNSKNNKRR